MNRNDTFSERLTETLKRRGYWSAKRKALEIGRFCVENGYLPSYVYRWLRGEVPRAENLLLLARQLDADPAWLVGLDTRDEGPSPAKRRRRPVPIAGGSDASVPGSTGTPCVGASAAQVANNTEEMPLIGRWAAAIYHWLLPVYGRPQFA